MNPTEGKANALRELCQLGNLTNLVEEYIIGCHSPTTTESENKARYKKSASSQFPNLAGFCRYVGTSPDKLEALLSEFPDEKEKLWAILEDEALNSQISPTIVTAYLKKRLGYEKDSRPTTELPRQLNIQFEHDIFEDGE